MGNIDVGGSQGNSAANGYGGSGSMGGSGTAGVGLNDKNKFFGGGQINISGEGVAGKSG